MMFAGSRRRMFRNETPATKKPSLTRQAIGILASSRELMDEVQPMRMANGGSVNVIETYLDQAQRMATEQGLRPGSMLYNQVVGTLYNKLSSTDPSVDQLFPPRVSEPLPVDVSTPLTREAFPRRGVASFKGLRSLPVDIQPLGSTSAAVPQAGIPSLAPELPVDVSTPLTRGAFPQQGLGSFRGLNTPPVVEETLGATPSPVRMGEGNQTNIPSLSDEERYGSVDINPLNPFNPLGREPQGTEVARGTEAFKSGTAINPALVPKTAEEKAAEYSESTRSADQRFARDLKGKQGQVTRLEKRQESLKAKLSNALIKNNKKAEQTYRLQLTELEGNLKKARNELSVLEDVQGQKAQTKAEELQQRLEALKDNPDVSQEDLQALQEQIGAEQEKILKDDDATPATDEEPKGDKPDAPSPAVVANQAANNVEQNTGTSLSNPDEKKGALQMYLETLQGKEKPERDPRDQKIVEEAMRGADYDEDEIRESVKDDAFWNSVMLTGLSMVVGASEGGDRFSNMARAAIAGINNFNAEVKDREKTAYKKFIDKQTRNLQRANLILTTENTAADREFKEFAKVLQIEAAEDASFFRRQQLEQQKEAQRLRLQVAQGNYVSDALKDSGLKRGAVERLRQTPGYEQYAEKQKDARGQLKLPKVPERVLRTFLENEAQERFGISSGVPQGSGSVIKLDN